MKTYMPLVVPSILFLVVGCSSSVDIAEASKSGLPFCEARVRLSCEKANECLTAGESTRDCESLTAQCKQEPNDGCPTGWTYSASDAKTCLDEIAALNCTTLKSHICGPVCKM